MNDTNFMVFGSEGAIGQRLVELLPNTIPSAKIIRVARTENVKTDRLGNTLLIGDLLDPNAVAELFNYEDVDVVIFCAARWNGLNQDPSVFNDNVTMINNVLLWLPSSVKKFIFLSSSAVYATDNTNEAHVVDSLPHSTYGKSKLISELLLLNKARQNGMEVTIYRPFHVVSPCEAYNPGCSHITTDFVHRYIELGQDFEWETLSNDIFIPFCWVDDLCDVIFKNLLHKQCTGAVFNIGPQQSHSIYSLAVCVATIGKKYGLTKKSFLVPERNASSTDSKITSRLAAVDQNLRERDIMEIVELFVTMKYGLTYEC